MEEKVAHLGLYARFFKRFLDVFISFDALIILSPIFLLISILSILILKGNPIFKQYRPGKNGKIFALLKFRSMTNKTDEKGELLPDAQRMTKWGKFLRKTSLDELPQLINILKGDMSIIGPRPRLIKDMVFYDNEIIQRAYCVRPGLTGPAQVYDRDSSDSWEEVFKRDLDYAEHITFAGDMKLFFKTFAAIFKGGACEGEHCKKEKREYYYSNDLLKSNKVSKQQYDEGISLANEMEKQGKGFVKNYSDFSVEKSEENSELNNQTKDKKDES